MTLDVGIVGLASYYGPADAERAAARPDCSVVAATAADVDDEALSALGRPTRTEFAETYDCRLHEDVASVLDAVDVVVVATRTSRRAADGRRALAGGLPVLVAKPAADDYESARRLAEAAADAAVPVAFTTPARYDDALLWLAPSAPERVDAEYASVNSPHSAHPDLGTATVRFVDDALGTATMTYSTDCREAWGNWEVEVVGTEGILRTGHQGYEGLQWHGGDVRRAAEVGPVTVDEWPPVAGALDG
jgi:predicted dehydrogenase